MGEGEEKTFQNGAHFRRIARKFRNIYTSGFGRNYYQSGEVNRGLLSYQAIWTQEREHLRTPGPFFCLRLRPHCPRKRTTGPERHANAGPQVRKSGEQGLSRPAFGRIGYAPAGYPQVLNDCLGPTNPSFRLSAHDGDGCSDGTMPAGVSGLRFAFLRVRFEELL